MHLPKVKDYMKAFNIEGPLQELVHLICAKPFLHSLAFHDMDLKWHQDENFEKEIKESEDDFVKAILNGYIATLKREKLEKTSDYYHHEEIKARSFKKLPERFKANANATGTDNLEQITDPVLDFFQKLFRDEVTLPYGMLSGYELREAYPKIAAINTYCGFFGNPVLSRAYQLRAIDSEENGQDIKDWLITLIGDDQFDFKTIKTGTYLSGCEMRGNNFINAQEFSQLGAQLAFLDEPKLYEAKGDEIFTEYLKTIRNLDDIYNDGKDCGLVKLLEEARAAISDLRKIESYIGAKGEWKSLSVSTPKFPLFAWGFDDSDKAIKARDEASEVYFEALRQRISESNSEIVETELIEKELERELENKEYSGYDILTLSKNDLNKICSTKKHGRDKAIEVYEAILRTTACSLVKENFLRDAKAPSFKVQAPNKHLSDLGLLSHILKETGFFKTLVEATVFVASNFEVSDDDGLMSHYLPGTIRQKQKSIKDSKRKGIWKEWKRKVDQSFDSEK